MSENRFKISYFTIILIFVCLAIVGLAVIPKLPFKFSPSKTLPRISVNFFMYGNPPRIIEMEVTSKLEAMLNRIKGVKNISSTSYIGEGQIDIEFDRNSNIEMARFEVSTIIRQAWHQLPSEVSYPRISVSRSDDNANRPFLSYTINAPAAPLFILQYVENQIKPKLAQIKGIYNIDVGGATPMEWQLKYDYKQLEALSLQTSDIYYAIQNYLNREFFGIGTITATNGKEQWIRIALVLGEKSAQKDNLENIEIKIVNGKIIRLKDIVNVENIESQPRSYYRVNGLNSIYMNITAEENANQLELSKKIKEELLKLKQTFPENYEIHLSYDATDYIKTELEKIYFRSGLTLIILLLFVLITYRNLKYTLLIVISLVINILIAAIFYYLFKLEMQLYSLAGVTISLTLIIDNTIIVSDQIIRKNNMNVFLAVLAATMTTIASLSIIFFLDEQLRLNLQDFAIVIIINLAISLLIALFFVPALLDMMRVTKKKAKRKRFKSRGRMINIWFNRFYAEFCCFVWRWKIAVIILIIIAFGLPIFMLPDKINKQDRWSELYNKTLGSDIYKEKFKKNADNLLGGTLRLFIQKVYTGSYFAERGETIINITARMPSNTTISQLNELIQHVEIYLSKFPEIRQFQTNIPSSRTASINVMFTKKGLKSGFPYELYNNLIFFVIHQSGGGGWRVSGMGDGFSNDFSKFAGEHTIELYGFNYDELYLLAEKLKSKLLEDVRILEVTIDYMQRWLKDDYEEYIFDIYKERLAHENIQPYQLNNSLNNVFRQYAAGILYSSNGAEQIRLRAHQLDEYDIWNMNNMPLKIGTGIYKLSELADINRRLASQAVAKINQEYLLVLQYPFIGPAELGKITQETILEEFKNELPIGYDFKTNYYYDWNWNKNNKQYLLLLLVFVIIYFNSSILFNSFKQPFYIIFVIPISYIGVFLSFYLFKLNFDHGGFASFILLSGLTINANIYILDEFNNIMAKNRRISRLKAYIRAWNSKIRPIFLTVISTALGFLPFIIGYKEAFWFPLAIGTIGGMIVSVIATFCFLPLFMGVAKK